MTAAPMVVEVRTVTPDTWVENDVDKLNSQINALQQRIGQIQASCDHDFVKTGLLVTRRYDNHLGRTVRHVTHNPYRFSSREYPEILVCCTKCSATKDIDQRTNCPIHLVPRVPSGKVSIDPTTMGTLYVCPICGSEMCWT